MAFAACAGLSGWSFAGSPRRARADAAAPPRAAAVPKASAVSAPVLDRSTGTLKQVQVVFRHGARTPLTGERYLFFDSTWGPETCGRAYEGGARLDVRGRDGLPTPPAPGDVAQQECKLPGGGCHKGELTLLGQKQAVGLGSWLRARYASDLGFLPPGYAPGLLACRTTKFSRTRETLRGVLTGLYPDNETPIPVVSSSDIDQLLYADSAHCPHLGLLMEASAAKLAAEMRADAHARAELHAAVEAAIPALPEGFWSRKWSYTDIHDALTSLTTHGKAIPAGLTPQIRRQIDLLATRQFAAYLAPSLDDEHGHAMLRLSMGRLLDIMLDHMRAAAGAIQAAEAAEAAGGAGSSGNGNGSSGGTDQPKLFLYSGHDSTLLPLLLAVGVDVQGNGWPPYLSNIIVELWELHEPQPTVSSSSGNSSGEQQQQQQQQHHSTSPPHHPLTSDGGRFAVRVLYNREPLALPGCPPGKLMGLSTFERELLGGFILSEQDHAQACMVPLDHDSPLPAAVSPANPNAAATSGAGAQAAAAQQQAKAA